MTIKDPSLKIYPELAKIDQNSGMKIDEDVLERKVFSLRNDQRHHGHKGQADPRYNNQNKNK